MKTIQIRRIDPISASASVLIIYAVIFGVIGIVELLLASARGKADTTTPITLLPMIITVFVSSLAVLVFCIIYNLISLRTGGIKLTVTEADAQTTAPPSPMEDKF